MLYSANGKFRFTIVSLWLNVFLYKVVLNDSSAFPNTIMDDIITRLHALTISNLATAPPAVSESAAPPLATSPPPASTIDNLEHAVNQLTLGDINLPSPLSPPSAPETSTDTSLLDSDLKRLWLLDEKFDFHMKSMILCFDALASPDTSSQHAVEVNLTAEKRWLQESIRELHGLERYHKPEIHILAEAMRDRMAQFAAAIDFCIETLQKRSPPQSSQHIVNSGNNFAHALISNTNGTFRFLFCYQFAW
jgi:hypothetical protein